MSVIFENEGRKFVFMKGAVERVLEACPEYLDEMKRNIIIKNMETLASQGLRVLAFGSRWIHDIPGDRAQADRRA